MQMPPAAHDKWKPSRDERDEYRFLAPIYDLLLEPVLHPIRLDAIRMAKLCGCRKVLDLCCGTGKQAVMLHDCGFEVTGVDLSPSMIEEARRRSPGGIEYHREDASSLHFHDNTFGCVILSFALHEKEPSIRRRIMLEACRVLGKDGRMLLADYILPRPLLSRAAGAMIHGVERMAGKRHYASFRSYMKSGALDAIVRDHRLSPVLMQKHHFGATAILAAAPMPDPP